MSPYLCFLLAFLYYKQGFRVAFLYYKQCFRTYLSIYLPEYMNKGFFGNICGRVELGLAVVFFFFKWKVLVAQSCPTFCNPMDCSLPASSVHGISQDRVDCHFLLHLFYFKKLFLYG